MSMALVLVLIGAFIIGHIVWGDWADRISEAVG